MMNFKDGFYITLPYQAIMILTDDRGRIHKGEVLDSEAVSSSFFDEIFEKIATDKIVYDKERYQEFTKEIL
jgi:hypothetical protein